MWEEIKDLHVRDVVSSSARLKVPGGWLVRTILSGGGVHDKMALIFVADSEHKWELEK